MAARSIATLSLSFGLVSIPVKLYSATESSSAIRFKLMAAGGARVRQQYVTDDTSASAEADAPPPASTAGEPEPTPEPEPVAAKGRAADSRVLDFPTRMSSVVAAAEPPVFGPSVVERSEMVKGYEFEKGSFVLFTADELKALEEGSRQTIDIVSFIPERSVDPVYYDKAYFLAPDKRGAKPYSLLLRAMRDSGRCALAKWAFRSKEYVVQIRPAEGGMVLQQLLYAEEVRSLGDLHIELADVGDAELKLARQLIDQISSDSYDPTQFVDEEKKRILAAVEEKIEGRRIVTPEQREAPAGGQVVDMIEALRASLRPMQASEAVKAKADPVLKLASGERKPVRRAQPKAIAPAASAKRPSSKR